MRALSNLFGFTGLAKQFANKPGNGGGMGTLEVVAIYARDGHGDYGLYR